MRDIIYLTVEDVLTVHKMVMQEFGMFVRDIPKECIEKIIVEPQTGYFGEEQYPGFFRKAALYWYRITTVHCFQDGNKRTGVVSLDLFLRYNGYEVKSDGDELFEYCLKIANHATRPSLCEVEDWLMRNTKRVDGY